MSDVVDIEGESVLREDSGAIPEAKVTAGIDFEPLRQVSGFLGAALADSVSGLTLGSEAVGQIEIEALAAGHAELLRVRRKLSAELESDEQIDEMLISLEQHIHLLIPLGNNRSLFLYSIFDRAKANPAMALHVLRKFERQLRHE